MIKLFVYATFFLGMYRLGGLIAIGVRRVQDRVRYRAAWDDALLEDAYLAWGKEQGICPRGYSHEDHRHRFRDVYDDKTRHCSECGDPMPPDWRFDT